MERTRFNNIEDLCKVVEDAVKRLPERPDITLSDARITGVRLNGEMIDSLPVSKGTELYRQEIKVYRDDLIKTPKFIVEGEIRTKSYLKWEALDLSDIPGSVKVKLVRMNGNVYELKVFYSGGEKFALLTDYLGLLCCTFREYNSKFFNDLRLEVIEDEQR